MNINYIEILKDNFNNIKILIITRKIKTLINE